MFQKQQRLGENFEIVFGLGLLNWNSPDGRTVRRHLVVARVTIEFDTATGTLTVTPAGEGAHPSIEQDMLDPQYWPDPQELHAISEVLEEIGESLWAIGPLDELLKRWVNSVAANAEYSASIDPPKNLSQRPLVQLAPALMLRRRTERSFILAFEEIIRQLDAGGSVMEGVSRFISVSDDQELGGLRAKDGNGSGPSEIFFPLPANDAQRQIVERLTTNQGVLVQGPPGTGKSHTIVNLICHALASGQRILVTSHAVRALKVLQRMIRERTPDLAPLSVVLLGDDREALLAMEESVQGITTKQNSWDPKVSLQTIDRLDSELHLGRKKEARVLADIRAIREQETFSHKGVFGYTGTLARIAEVLRDEKESLSWIPDHAAEELEPPLTAIELDELVSLLRNERISHWAEGGWSSISIDGLPTADPFEQLVQAEQEAGAAYEKDDSIRQRPEYTALQGMPEADRLDFKNGLSQLIALIERVHRRPLPWARTATSQILGDLDRTWRQLHEDTHGVVELTRDLAVWLDENPVSHAPGTNLQQALVDAEDLLLYLNSGRGWGFWPFRAEVVKRSMYLREVRIGGRRCATTDTLNDLTKRLFSEIEFRQLSERWSPWHEFSVTSFVDRVAELADLCEPLDEAFKALSMTDSLSEILRRSPGSPDPDWADLSSLRDLHETLATLEVTQRYESARGQIERMLEGLRMERGLRNPDPILEEFMNAIMQRNVSAYATALQQAAENIEIDKLLHRRQQIFDKLVDGAPHLANVLSKTPDDAVWDEKAAEFERAWNWSRAHSWVRRLAAPASEQQHRLHLEHLKKENSRTLEKLAAERAWHYCFKRMTRNEREHLVAWSKAVRSIGRGTGKYAPMHRRNAREHLNECRSAIPAWVMPLHRVAETIKPGSEVFDIAIIDEASQSGPEALLLAYLAKKLVVVGDDKQIQPTYAGVNVEDVNQLRERYIKELPHADAYGVNQSFFDLAEIRYEGRIRLREHFRCMPEIIQFSNNLSYRGEPLIPLRQYGAGRLEPTIETRHIADSYVRGTGARLVNLPEAEAIVDEVVRIHHDSAYDAKTIGIISLVGEAQAREIETRLVRRLGPEEMEHRQILCGNAYAFQGDERDIMLLSMVSAPQEDRRIPALTDEASQRRFNVAASRARDQMYLFHTATLSDLNPRCLRYKLLEYCSDPKVAPLDASGLDVTMLERMAIQADRQHMRPPAPFDSWFELDVFLQVARRGYRVISQYEVGGYRIDLVVQGMSGSLAVECDGDAWHGPDRYETDTARQRDLERCGWEFWRVRESVFRLDASEALSNLWDTLERLQIVPKAEEAGGNAIKQVAAIGDIEPGKQAAGQNGEPGFVELVGELDASPDEEGPTPLGPPIQLSCSEWSPKSANRVDEPTPYTRWQPMNAVPDPRTAQQAQLISVLAEVVECEGPIVAIRAYRLINQESGSRRLTKPALSALNRACAAAVKAGVLIDANPLGQEGQVQRVLRSPGSPAIVLRQRGPRELDELPPDEVAILLSLLRKDDHMMEAEDLKRQALGELGWVRLTRKVNAFLDRCITLAGIESGESQYQLDSKWI